LGASAGVDAWGQIGVLFLFSQVGPCRKSFESRAKKPEKLRICGDFNAGGCVSGFLREPAGERRAARAETVMSDIRPGPFSN